uniref:Uncharacterized protein n=1 Tax=Arundo donax TaxID=35708 RepID=A0A0A8Z2N2_ARUDO
MVFVKLCQVLVLAHIKTYSIHLKLIWRSMKHVQNSCRLFIAIALSVKW